MGACSCLRISHRSSDDLSLCHWLNSFKHLLKEGVVSCYEKQEFIELTVSPTSLPLELFRFCNYNSCCH
ncbi:unnamed protein product [Brassica rapa subsp. trilocularis]